MNYSLITIGYKSVSNVLSALTEAKNSTIPPKETIVIYNPYQNVDIFLETNKRVDKYALLSHNIGCCKAFNLGLKMCSEQYAVVLSDDCRVGINTYEKMLNEFNDPKVGIVGVESGGSYNEKSIAKGFILMLSIKMINEIGGYDELASPLADETELGYRAWANGWKTAIAPNCQWHHVHDISNNPYAEINYLGQIVSPMGKNAVQPKYVPILQAKVEEYKKKL